jgi:uncharacterized membrane protein
VLVLIIGLVIFLGLHSTRIVADDWRSRKIASLGERPWKGLYSILSLIGFGLIIWGYSLARQQPVVIWDAPLWTRHAASLLVLIAFILLAATYVPRNHFKAAIGHPMLAGTKLWAFAHLLANGTLADVLLFGSFLVWSIFGFRSARRRDRLAKTQYPSGTIGGTVISVIVGAVAWVVFAFFLHGRLIGVNPLG